MAGAARPSAPKTLQQAQDRLRACQHRVGEIDRSIPLRLGTGSGDVISDVGISRRLLLSHFLTKLGDRAWEFAVPLALATTYASLGPASLFGLATEAARVVFGTSIGAEVDRRNRLKVVWAGTLVQALAVLSTGLLLALLARLSAAGGLGSPFDSGGAALVFLASLAAACVGALGAFGMELAVTKDWVPVALPEGEWGTLNARMCRIDLACEIGSPALVTLFFLAGPGAGVAITALLNFLSFIPEYKLLRAVYYARPALAGRPDAPPPTAEHGAGWRGVVRRAGRMAGEAAGAWRAFGGEPVALVIVAFALLWLSVLVPHGIVLTAYLKATAVPDLEIAAFRGLSALVGVTSTFLFPPASARFGLHAASMAAVGSQAACLLASAVCFHLRGHGGGGGKDLVLRLFFMGLILASRCGLYAFDVGYTEIMQRGVPEAVRGKVNSVGGSLTSVASLAVYAMGAAADRPANFVYLVWASVACIAGAAALFALWLALFEYVDAGPRPADLELEGPAGEEKGGGGKSGADEAGPAAGGGRYQRRGALASGRGGGGWGGEYARLEPSASAWQAPVGDELDPGARE